jgi:hypothetical protein
MKRNRNKRILEVGCRQRRLNNTRATTVPRL